MERARQCVLWMDFILGNNNNKLSSLCDLFLLYLSTKYLAIFHTVEMRHLHVFGFHKILEMWAAPCRNTYISDKKYGPNDNKI